MNIDGDKLPTFSALVLRKLEFICVMYDGAGKAGRAHGVSPAQIRKWRKNPAIITLISIRKIDQMYDVAWERRELHRKSVQRRHERNAIHHGGTSYEPPPGAV